MIYITGDTHGLIDFAPVRDYFAKEYVTYERDYLIILGDAGIVWSKESFSRTIGAYDCLGLNILYLDGNHENFDLLNEFPIVEYHHARCHMISDHIYHVLRGEILELYDLKFLCIGGAQSIDKACRVEHLSWWRDETITLEDMNHALENLKKVNFKVNYILTHCLDADTVSEVYGYAPDQSTRFLNQLEGSVRYTKWYCGHYHEDRAVGKKKRIFYHDIVRLPQVYRGKKTVTDTYYYCDFRGRICSRSGSLAKIRSSDLPEWFYGGYGEHYYSLKGVTDVAFMPSPCDNHIDKDSSIFLSYEGKIEKDERLIPKKGYDDSHIHTWRVDLLGFVKGLEKFSPKLNLTPLKHQINAAYDFYNTNGSYDMAVIPYPGLEGNPTSRRNEVTYTYEVKLNQLYFGYFTSMERAKKYIGEYLKREGGDGLFETLADCVDNYQIRFPDGNVLEAVRIEKVK